MSRCRSCHQPVVWAETDKGKRIPLDGEDQGGFTSLATFADGNLVAVGSKLGEYGSTPIVRYVKAGEGRYRTHFSSCPEASEWRRR
jgi:hypothetical protein